MSEVKFERIREMKRLEMQMAKADAAIAELEFKIIEREEDIQRMKNNIEVQRKVKLDSGEQLKEMSKEK